LTAADWPEHPTLQFLVHWLLRRDQICDGSRLCPEAPDDATRCQACPLTRLDAAMDSHAGLVLQRAIDLEAALKLGFHLTLEDVTAEEFAALQILSSERDRREAELNQHSRV
jgi:hypothetical protein